MFSSIESTGSYLNIRVVESLAKSSFLVQIEDVVSHANA